MTDTLTQFGLFGMFTHWPVYALIVVSIVAELLDQTALHVGPLSISQPFIVIVDPIVSIVLSVWIFDEVFTENAFRLTVGIVVLRRHVRRRRRAGPHHPGHHGARPGAGYIASSGKKLTQLVCMDAPSATMVAPQT